MAFNYSTGFKNYVCKTGSIKAAFDGAKIQVYSGTVPASADASIGSATLLNTYAVATTGMELDDTTVEDGVISKVESQTWSGTAVATGVASFFRAVQTGDANGSSTTLRRIQGTVGLAGADLNVSNTTFTSGVSYTIDYFALAFADL